LGGRRGLAAAIDDVTTTFEAGLAAALDVEHLGYAFLAGRVMITQDTDFLRLHAEGAVHSGIAFLHQGEKTGYMLRMLVLLFELVTAEEMAGRLEFL
jgi:predicted nuclease of predicted toxin-antitoxin system